MQLLHQARLRDEHTVVHWQRLLKRLELDGGVYRFLECHEKRETAAKMCRYCSNDLWLQRSLQLNDENTKKAKKKQKGVKSFDPPVVTKMAMTLSHSLPPGALLPPLEHETNPALAKTIASFEPAPSYFPYASEKSDVYVSEKSGTMPYQSEQSADRSTIAWGDPMTTLRPSDGAGRDSSP
jgi:hypothetical protein